MARKFKKKLAPKRTTKKTAVLSVELVRKETIEKVTGVWKDLISKLKTFKLASK